MEVQAVVALVIGVVLVFLVPAVIWSAIVAGVYQIVRNKVRGSLKSVARRLAVVRGTK